MHFPAAFHEAIAHNAKLLGTINTGVLLTSSTLVALAVHALRAGDRQRHGCGSRSARSRSRSCFSRSRASSTRRHFAEGIFPACVLPEHDARGGAEFWTLYYGMTGLHAIHVIIGIGVLGVAPRGCRPPNDRARDTRIGSRSARSTGTSSTSSGFSSGPSSISHEPAIANRRSSIQTAAALFALWLASFALSYVHLGAAAIPVAFGIAAIKAVLVVLFFMELAAERLPMKLPILSAIALLATLVGLLVADIVTRDAPPLLPFGTETNAPPADLPSP